MDELAPLDRKAAEIFSKVSRYEIIESDMMLKLFPDANDPKKYKTKLNDAMVLFMKLQELQGKRKGWARDMNEQRKTELGYLEGR